MPDVRRQIYSLIKSAPSDLRSNTEFFEEHPGKVLAAAEKVLRLYCEAQRLGLQEEQMSKLRLRVHTVGSTIIEVSEVCENDPGYRKHLRRCTEILLSASQLLGVTPQHLQAAAATRWIPTNDDPEREGNPPNGRLYAKL